MLMQEFEAQLVDVYNECDLPGEAKRYVVAHFASIIEDAYQKDMVAFQSLRKKKSEETKQEETLE